MRYHCSHKFDKFIKVADQNLLREYFKIRRFDIPGDQKVTPEISHKLISRIPKEEDQLDITEELLCLNDIADRPEMMEEVAEQFKIKCKEDDPPETIALRIFLHKDPEAFELAFDHYLCTACTEKLNHYPLPCDTFSFNDDTIGVIKEELQTYFKEKRRTDNCYIRDRQYQGKHYILIARGDVKKTITELDGKKLKPRPYRPAKEDIIVYNKDAGVFSINSGVKNKTEKELYIRSFSKHILGIDNIGKEIFSSESRLINLRPVLRGDFYSETNDIAEVKLTELFVIHHATNQTDIVIKSDDAMQSLKDIPFPVGKHQLVSVRLNFFMRGKKRPVPVQLTTRGSTHIKHRREKMVIEDYLRDRKVLAF